MNTPCSPLFFTRYLPNLSALSAEHWYVCCWFALAMCIWFKGQNKRDYLKNITSVSLTVLNLICSTNALSSVLIFVIKTLIALPHPVSVTPPSLHPSSCPHGYQGSLPTSCCHGDLPRNLRLTLTSSCGQNKSLFSLFTYRIILFSAWFFFIVFVHFVI